MALAFSIEKAGVIAGSRDSGLCAFGLAVFVIG